PLEHAWVPRPEEIRRYKEVRPLASNPWTVLGTAASVSELNDPSLAPVDLHDPTGEHVLRTLFGNAAEKEKNDNPPPTKPAWHGTLLPATDADLWLASSFADYESMVSLERGYAENQPTKCLCVADYDKLTESLFAARARYFAGRRAG